MTELEHLRLENKTLRMQRIVTGIFLRNVVVEWKTWITGRDVTLRTFYANELEKTVRELEKEIDKVKYVEVK